LKAETEIEKARETGGQDYKETEENKGRENTE
jgi:hypothetical protein